MQALFDRRQQSIRQWLCCSITWYTIQPRMGLVRLGSLSFAYLWGLRTFPQAEVYLKFWCCSWLTSSSWTRVVDYNYDPTPNDTSGIYFDINNTPQHVWDNIAEITSINRYLRIIVCSWSMVRTSRRSGFPEELIPHSPPGWKTAIPWMGEISSIRISQLVRLSCALR